MNTLILIPTYNERENIRTAVMDVFKNAPEVSIMVIDDNSPDGTASVVEEMMLVFPRLMLLKRVKKEGLGVAYKTAITKVCSEFNFDTIVTMDADGSHDALHLREILQKLEVNDLVVGSRYIRGGGVENWEPWRFMLSKYGNFYANFLAGVPVRDLTAGYVGFKTNIISRMQFERLSASGYAYQIEFKFYAFYYANAKCVEVPIFFRNRKEGESKISKHIVREGAVTPIRLFFKRFRYFLGLNS